MADLYSLWTKILNFLMTIVTRFLTSVKLGILYLSFRMFAYKSKQIVRADFIAYNYSLTKIYFEDHIVKL